MRVGTGARYLVWAAVHGITADTSCPGCTSAATLLLKRKMLVTCLFECNTCGLRFRVPKETEAASKSFYQEEYEQGFTSTLPSTHDLRLLLARGFVGHEKDYSEYVQVLMAVGLRDGARLLDFGCSWGYGSYQLRQAGFDVISHEISRKRAAYAASVLGLRLIENPHSPGVPVDCFFSAHVMEHLPNPNIIWRAAIDALTPSGVFVAFVPNGDPETESVRGSKRYHQLWGKAHPLLVTSRHAKFMASRYGFACQVYSSPYHLPDIAARRERRGVGDELLIVAQRI